MPGTSNDSAYSEVYRPQFHFSARKHWLNDPNGLVCYAGEYHLFFQHNPSSTEWGNMTWGHAVSTDLLHWRQMDHAIHPDRLGTIFSGSAVVDWPNTAGFQQGNEKTIVAIYTAAGATSPESKDQPYTQCIAYSTDRGRTWTKYAGNPVLKHIRGSNRDPKVVWHVPTQSWIMTLYLDHDVYAFFSSPDLKSWTHLHDMAVPGCGECPDFFQIAVDGNPASRKWVWTAGNGRYLIGAFDGSRFTAETALQQADWGTNYYAVQTFSDIPESDGRRIQIAWMNGGFYPDMPFNQQMGFPCELTLRTTPQGLRLFREPVRELQLLRNREWRWTDLILRPGENPLAELRGDCFEIQLAIEPRHAVKIGLRLRDETIRYSVTDQFLKGLGKIARVETVGGRLDLRVLLDRTSIEIFAQSGAVPLSFCFLPEPGERGLELYAQGGEARIVDLRVWELASVWR